MSVLLCTAGFDHTIRFWEAPTGVCLEQLPFAESQVNRLVITPDRRFVAAAGNPIIRIFDLAAKAPLRTFEGHSSNVTGIGFQKNGSWMFSSGEDGTIKIWDMRAPGYQRNYDTGSSIMASVLHPNQAEVVIGDVEGKVKIWDLAEDKLVHTLECDWKIPIRDVTIAVDASLLVAVNNRGSCFSWNYQSTQDQWNPQHRMEAHSSYCLKAVLSPDVRFLATCSSDRTIKLWNADDQFSEIRTLSGHQRWVWDCAFSADSAYLVTASSDKSARLWEVSSGDVVMDYRGHTKSVTCIALNDCVSN